MLGYVFPSGAGERGEEMKPLYGSVNDSGLWWDGKAWRKWWEEGNGDSVVRHVLRTSSTIISHAEKNCHPDGCFECPRCRLIHFIPDNYDFLCDTCCDILLSHDRTPQDIKDSILSWRSKARKYYSGEHDSDIVGRHVLREKMMVSNEEKPNDQT